MFQSPSHRGGSAPTGCCFRCGGSWYGFNPLLIGAGALPSIGYLPSHCCRRVSIPFSSGRERSHHRGVPVLRFNRRYVSIPFSSGRERSQCRVNRYPAGDFVSIPFSSGRERSPFLKPALCQQPFRVYFSRMSQSNAFLSPQPSPARPPPSHPNSHRSNHIHRFRAPPPSPTQFSQSPQTIENKPTTRKTAGPPPLPPFPSPWSSRRTSRTV